MQETLMILDLEFGCAIHLFYSLCGVGIYFSCEVKLVEETRKTCHMLVFEFIEKIQTPDTRLRLYLRILYRGRRSVKLKTETRTYAQKDRQAEI